MPTSRCPIVRPQASKYGPLVNDYHSFDGNAMRAVCKHCGQTRRACQIREFDRYNGGGYGDPPPHERFNAAPPNPERWASVTSLLARDA